MAQAHAAPGTPMRQHKCPDPWPSSDSGIWQPPKTRLRYELDGAWVSYDNDRWKRLLFSVGATLIFEGAVKGSELRFPTTILLYRIWCASQWFLVMISN